MRFPRRVTSPTRLPIRSDSGGIDRPFSTGTASEETDLGQRLADDATAKRFDVDGDVR